MSKLIKDRKANKLDPWNDVLARWLLMLGMVDRRSETVYEDIYKELEGIAMQDDKLHDAFKNWERLGSTQEEVLAYEARLKQVNDEEAAIEEAKLREEEARQEGKEEGIKEVAKNLLLQNIDEKQIIKATKITREELERIKRSIG